MLSNQRLAVILLRSSSTRMASGQRHMLYTTALRWYDNTKYLRASCGSCCGSCFSPRHTGAVIYTLFLKRHVPSPYIDVY